MTVSSSHQDAAYFYMLLENSLLKIDEKEKELEICDSKLHQV